MRVINRVELRGLDEAGRERLQIAFNSLTYAACDNMAAALTQSGPARITHLYGHHGGTWNPSSIAIPLPPNTDPRLTTRSDFMNSSTSQNDGGFWIPLAAAPAITSSGANFQGNLLTYYFQIPGTIPGGQYTGTFTPGTSKIYSLGLAVAHNTLDRTQDVIVSVLGNGTFTPFIIGSGGQESVNYPYQFTV